MSSGARTSRFSALALAPLLFVVDPSHETPLRIKRKLATWVLEIRKLGWYFPRLRECLLLLLLIGMSGLPGWLGICGYPRHCCPKLDFPRGRDCRVRVRIARRRR